MKIEGCYYLLISGRSKITTFLNEIIIPQGHRVLQHFFRPIFITLFNRWQKCKKLQRLHNGINDIGRYLESASFSHWLPF